MLKKQRRLILDATLLGVVGALSAQVFLLLLKVSQSLFLTHLAAYLPPQLAADSNIIPARTGPHGLWLVPLATTLGGLLAGLLIYSASPESEGHGTDTVVLAFHNLAGHIRARVPLVKLVASALTIGSGGSAGREGPTALISSGVASVYARWRHLSEEDSRLLLLVGMASGLSAIFRSPIGTAIFAVEVLYSDMELEAGALAFTLLGSVVAYSVSGLFVGFGPLFAVPADLIVPTAKDYGWYALLGIASGLVAAILPTVFYGTRDLFHRIPCPNHLKPAIGGAAVGLAALVLPQLLGGGYGYIQSAINGHIGASLLVALGFGKIITFALTIGSGGSGGVFAPSLFTGAMIGGALGQAFHQPAAAFAVVGMAAVFGAAARVPIATLLMVTEMTGGYHLLVAAALAVTVSSFVQSALTSSLKYRSLYENQVRTRLYSPAHYREDLNVALDLLRSQNQSTFPRDRGLELISLLVSGVPVSLPDQRQIRIGILRSRSACKGRPPDCLSPADDEVEIIVVLRGNRVLWPHPDIKLQPEDRLVIVASEPAWQRLLKHLAPVNGVHGGDSRPR